MKSFNSILAAMLVLAGFSCKSTTKWEGQGPIQIIPTESRAIEKQVKQTYFVGDQVYFSNEFEGARLNGAEKVNDTLYRVLILPENEPINPSPWYAFKVWSERAQTFWIEFTYSENGFHRYFPKISNDGNQFSNVDSLNFMLPKVQEGRPKEAYLKVTSSPDTLWIAAQDLVGTVDAETWKDKLAEQSFVERIEIGKSTEGRKLEVLKIGEADDREMLMVISMQHPPEVTGYLAMKSFVETICEDSPESRAFRKKYNLYLMPQMNPDGVANGHWRHNAGGIDTNRDWVNFNQPEPKALAAFMEKKVADTGGEFVFAADFHSTWEDIFYTINEDLEGNMPGLIPKLIKRSSKRIPGYDPNIRPTETNERSVTSNSYFFFVHGAESMTFEVGDNTPRDLIKQKGEYTARELMRLLK
ncbi:M14 family metallopeptidase [Algoriphagus namhaensis]|uniref:M14 family metallopeptidase n=1 Tax=Algoriphagus namhaensis TaxID=915353 RepID=A0ABV8AXG5_9BACT